ncbi:MAG TPA: hypothetical protein VHU18_12945 [Rhizomicrobium sp.]|jgi:hypothetical protein|nr:hypothetical protein [Rhizomicrobium sp.]
MAAVAIAENSSTRIERYLQLASDYDARAQRESDPEIRVDLYNTVVQFMLLADRATTAPGTFLSEKEHVRPRGVFHYRRSRLRIHPSTRAAAPASGRKLHTNAAASKILKVRKGSRPAPHPERGILSPRPQ